ncbi:hypothetical protein GCM10023094_48850 [Rhodococcus olei]|uniref:Uncharacterized protein n=1 Tax=Rhodococcus olei TaxID=2161675 RepID=A0ABP8PJK1_9NOCA
MIRLRRGGVGEDPAQGAGGDGLRSPHRGQGRGLGVRGDRHVAAQGLGIRGDRGQHQPEPRDQGGDDLRFEHVVGVMCDDRRRPTGRGGQELQDQVRVGGFGVRCGDRDRQEGNVERFGQTREGGAGVGGGAALAGARAQDVIGERHDRGELGADRYRIRGGGVRPVGWLVGRVGDARADREFVCTGKPSDEKRDRGVHHRGGVHAEVGGQRRHRDLVLDVELELRGGVSRLAQGRVRARQHRRGGQSREFLAPEVEVGALAQAHGADLGAVAVNRGDRGVGMGLEEFLGERDEVPVMRAQLVGPVAVGVAAEVDESPRRGTTLVDVHQQVLHRPGRDDVVLPDHRPEGDLLPEQHHVDHRAGQTLPRPAEPGVTADVLDAAPLVPQRPHQFELHPLHQGADGVVVGDGDLQRRDVDEHAAGALQGRGGARRHRKIDEHVAVTRHPREVAREPGDQNRRGRAAEQGVGVAEPVDAGL